MDFYIGQHFKKTYPPEAAVWCNANNAVMNSDGNGYTIVAISTPTPEEQAEQRRQEILAELDRIDRASARSLRAILTAQAAGNEPAHADIDKLAGYENEAVSLREELAGLNA